MTDQLNEIIKEAFADICEKGSIVCKVNNDQIQPRHREIISQLHEDVMKRYYGSGYLIPELIDGANVLDLGCGGGNLCYILSRLVGANGRVTGIDLTPELITAANQFLEYHREKWGYAQSNITFKVGSIENFDDIGLPESSLDVVVSNGVLCLCPNVRTVYEHVYRLLKDGGEFCLSDIYADRDRPVQLENYQKLFSFGLLGSLRWDKMGDIPVAVGFTKPYLVGAAPVTYDDETMKETLGNAEYICAEWRLFKLPPGARRSAAEVTYNGNIEGSEDSFRWDINTVFKKGEPVAVDSELATILAFSRYKNSFIFNDTTSSVTNPTNPFEYLDELRKQGKELTPVFSIHDQVESTD